MTDIRKGSAWLWLWITSFAVLWLLLIRHLAVHWAVNPQYSFGWLVPFLSGYLISRKWEDRPATGHSSAFASGLVLVIAAVLFFPTWLIEQPNPDWRLVSWAFAIEVVALSLAAIHLLGGRSWLKHFAFPFCLILSAVPWPTGIELVVIQGLMNGVAAVTVEVLGFLGTPAIQHGSVIEISAGMLGIDEACSGVRSLQATLMTSLYLGEAYRLCASRRLVLIGAGSLLAVICNIGRAAFLGWKAAHEGMEAVAKYHDPAGFTILTICFLLVWGVAAWMAPKPAPIAFSKSIPRLPPARWVAGLAAWLAFSLIATELWYRSHENTEKIAWDFAWPVGDSTFHDLPVAEAATKLLRYDQGRAATWNVGKRAWNAFVFKWDAGPARSRILARSHRPDICLPAAGLKLERDLGTITVDAAGLPISFRAFAFSTQGESVHVFHCVWQDGEKDSLSDVSQSDWNRSIGLDSVRRGQRNLGQQVLELVLVGYESDSDAEAAVRAELPPLISKSPVAGGSGNVAVMDEL